MFTAIVPRAFMVSSSPAPMFSSSRFNCFALGADLVLFLRGDLLEVAQAISPLLPVIIDDFIHIGVHDGVDDRRRVFPIGFGGGHLHDAGVLAGKLDADLARSAIGWHCARHPRGGCRPDSSISDRGGPP